MGIVKSDIQSVIHYDVPRSIENYVQEIGRTGRDGTLARCHMFLSNDDFYQLRRITLSDLLDTQSALLLTNKIVIQAKQTLVEALGLVEEGGTRKKRTIKQMEEGSDEEEDDEDAQMIKDFAHEGKISDMYEEANEFGIKFIPVKDQVEDKFYVSLEVKPLLRQLDLKKEVVLTMFN
jgi:superfamily II DNA helicase RecQ